MMHKLKIELTQQIQLNMTTIENRVSELKIDSNKIQGQDKQVEKEQKLLE